MAPAQLPDNDISTLGKKVANLYRMVPALDILLPVLLVLGHHGGRVSHVTQVTQGILISGFIRPNSLTPPRPKTLAFKLRCVPGKLTFKRSVILETRHLLAFFFFLLLSFIPFSWIVLCQKKCLVLLISSLNNHNHNHSSSSSSSNPSQVSSVAALPPQKPFSAGAMVNVAWSFPGASTLHVISGTTQASPSFPCVPEPLHFIQKTYGRTSLYLPLHQAVFASRQPPSACTDRPCRQTGTERIHDARSHYPPCLHDRR